MKNEIFANVGPRETRVAVREQDRLVELHIERASERGVAGGIYKGRVTRVLPGMQAAFVDIGLERAAFLYVSDYRAESLDDDLDEEEAPARRRGAAQRGQGAQIEDLLDEGREILVQVKKEPLGTKGARIESRISLAGRHLVLMPGVQRVGVSRRIDGDRERRRLRRIVESLRPKDQDLGFIVRTVSHGVSEADIQADIDYLVSRWDQVQKRTAAVTEAPALIYEEPPLHIRILRDLVTHETKQLVVDDAAGYGEMQQFVKSFMATPRPRIVHYKGERPLFDAERIEQEIEEGLGRKVWLKSGGHLVIDQCEALTAIDVNTGGFVGGKSRNLEETILKTNLEAVREIARQLRFRNIGGLIILDLIDMEVSQNREKVHRALLEAMREDKAKVNLLKISELGLAEMTRKRTRENLMQQLCDPCLACEGKGYLQSPRTVCHKIFRELPKAASYLNGQNLTLSAHPSVAEVLLGDELETLELVESRLERHLQIRPDPALHPEQFEISAAGPRVERPEAASEAPESGPLETTAETAAAASAESAGAIDTPAGAASGGEASPESELEEPPEPEAAPQLATQTDPATPEDEDAVAEAGSGLRVTSAVEPAPAFEASREPPGAPSETEPEEEGAPASELPTAGASGADGAEAAAEASNDESPASEAERESSWGVEVTTKPAASAGGGERTDS